MGRANNRDVWLRITGPRFWKRLQILHWKGGILTASAPAAVLAIACVSIWLPGLSIYAWAAMAPFIVVYWLLVLDHTGWD